MPKNQTATAEPEELEQITISGLPPGTRRRLLALARAEQRSLSAQVRVMLEQSLPKESDRKAA